MKLRSTKVWGGGRPTWELPASVGAECSVLEECWKDLHQGRTRQQRRSEGAEGGREEQNGHWDHFKELSLFPSLAALGLSCIGRDLLLWCMDSHCRAWASLLCSKRGLSPTRDRTRILCMGRWIPNRPHPRTTREVPGAPSLSSKRRETPGSFSAEERHSLAYSEGSPLALRLQIDLSDKGEGKRRESDGETVGLFQAPGEGDPEQSGD